VHPVDNSTIDKTLISVRKHLPSQADYDIILTYLYGGGVMDNYYTNVKLNSNSSLIVNFNGGAIGSDGGLVLYREFIEHIGLRDIIYENLDFIRLGPNAKYDVADKVIQQVIFQIAGYEDNNDAGRLAHDPVMKAVLDGKIASQPTLSRHENSFSREGIEGLQRANGALLKNVYTHEKPEVVILDIDSTEDKVHGCQEGARYNGHFGHVAYHPLLVFNGINGDFIVGELRDGNVYTSNGATDLLIKAFDIVGNATTRMIVRGDSGFADPKIFDLCEDKDSDYFIRLKANWVLWDLAREIVNQIDLRNYSNEQIVYGEFCYKAQSWRDYRRVLVKVHKEPDKLFYDMYFLCTNNLWVSPKQGWDFYQQRGNMENFIKESKLGFALDRLSCKDFDANAARMQIKGLSYNISNMFKRFCIPDDLKLHQIETSRTKITKIWCRILRHGRPIYVKLSSSYPYKKYFWEALFSVKYLYIAT